MTPRVRTVFALALLFLGAFLVRGLYLADGIAQLYTTEQDGTRMARRYDDTALAILSGDGILFPRVWDPARTGLASRPPGYPMFLASVYALLGRGFPLVAAVQDVLTSLAVLLGFFFVRRRFGFFAGVLAGGFMALSPHLAATSNLILADAIAPLPLLAAFLIVVPALDGGRSRREEFLRFTAMGLLIGVGIWLRPNVLLLGPFAAFFLFFLLGRTRRALTLASLVAMTSLLVVAPITLRNWLLFGEFVPVSINGGITLWQGVADAGGKEYGARVWDKQVMSEEAERYGRPDYLLWWAEPEGIARDRDRYKRATDVIKARPFWYARAMVRRMGAMALFLHGPRPLSDGVVATTIENETPVPLQKAPGLDTAIDDATFAARAGFASFLRAPLRWLHELWFLIPVLVWSGVIIALRFDRRATVLWLIVPLYYLVFESPFLYEWRVAVPMQYFLLSFAGVSVGATVNALRRRASAAEPARAD